MKERKFHCSVGVTGTLQWLEKRKRFRVDLCGKYIGAFKSREEADIVLSDALKQRNVLIHNRHDDRFDDAGDIDPAWRAFQSCERFLTSAPPNAEPQLNCRCNASAHCAGLLLQVQARVLRANMRR